MDTRQASGFSFPRKQRVVETEMCSDAAQAPDSG